MSKSKSRPGHAQKVAARNARNAAIAQVQQKGAVDLNNVIGQYAEAFEGISSSIRGMERDLRKMSDIVDALASLTDPDLLAAAVKAVQDKKSVIEATRARALIEQLVQKGEWKVVDKVAPGCLLGLREENQEGVITSPYLQVQFDSFSADLKADFQGKGIGATYEFPGRAIKATITDIWSRS